MLVKASSNMVCKQGRVGVGLTEEDTGPQAVAIVTFTEA